MVLWLIGMMGSGKTSVGETVASALGLSFIDTDMLITSVSARSIPEIWDEDGEESFRALERQMVASAADSGPAVVATGGGVVLDRENIERMRSSGLVVWLSASPRALEERIGRAGGRPLLAEGAPVDRLKALLEERLSRYSEAAHIEIPTDDRTIDEIASDVIGQWTAS
jgi:shikimate kinase